MECGAYRRLCYAVSCSTFCLEQVRGMLTTYGAKYRSLKAPRKLEWKPNLGAVQLELTIGDQNLEFNVR